MADDRTGLSSFGQQLLDQVLLDLATLISLHGDPAVFGAKRDELAAERARVAAGVPAPVEQVEINTLLQQIEQLNRRLAEQHAAAPAPVEVPAASNPVAGQTPMVTQPGPHA